MRIHTSKDEPSTHVTPTLVAAKLPGPQETTDAELPVPAIGIPISSLPNRIRTKVKEMDTDKDGTIDANELGNVIQHLLDDEAELANDKKLMKLYKYIILAMIVLVIIMIAAMGALSYTMAIMTRQFTVTGGVMLDRSTGLPMQTANLDTYIDNVTGFLTTRSSSQVLRSRLSWDLTPVFLWRL